MNSRKLFKDGDGGDGGDGGAGGAGDGKGATGVYNIPDDIKSDPIFEKYPEQESRDRALIEAQKFLGREKLPVPSGPEDTAAYDMIFNTLGRPKTADDYVVPTDIEIPNGLPIDQEMVSEFKKVSHEKGILPSQFDSAYKWFVNYQIGQYKKLQDKQVADSKAVEVEFRKEYGAAYDQNVTLANKLIAQFGDKNTAHELTNIVNGKGNNPGLFRMFVNVAKVLGEDQLVGKPSTLATSPEEAMSEIKKMEGDLKGPLFDESHPQHQEYVDKRKSLYKLLP